MTASGLLLRSYQVLRRLENGGKSDKRKSVALPKGSSLEGLQTLRELLGIDSVCSFLFFVEISFWPRNVGKLVETPNMKTGFCCGGKVPFITLHLQENCCGRLIFKN